MGSGDGMIEAGPVEREEELEQILDLQRANLPRQLSAVEMAAVLILVFRFLAREERAEFRPCYRPPNRPAR